jgi:hypothetical protein
MKGAELLSSHTAMVLHPMVADATQEMKNINIEKVEAASLAAVAQGAAQGSIPPNDIARILELLRQDNTVEDAINTAHEEAQKRQATQAPPPQEGQAQSPQTQPGLAQPGQGAEQPAIPQPPVGLQNFHGLTQALKQPPAPAALNGPA